VHCITVCTALLNPFITEASHHNIMFAYEFAIYFNVSLKMHMSGLKKFYIPLNKLMVLEIWNCAGDFCVNLLEE
jgi:hypothetical protein